MTAHRRVSVPLARDNRGETFEPSTISDSPPYVKPLACAECGVPVKAVTESVRRSSRGLQFTVKAHFSLHDRRRHDHKKTCKFAFDTQAGAIATEFADEVKRKGPHYVLMLRQATTEGADGAPQPLPSPTLRMEIQPRHAGQRHDRTIQAAAAVIKLLRLFNDDPAAVAAFRARWKGKTIRWNDFCFDVAKDFDRLDSLLQGHLEYPIAVHGVVSSAVDTAANGESWVLRLESGTARATHTVALRSRDRRSIDFPSGTQILGYGEWGRFTTKASRQEIRLWADRPGSAAQVLR